MMLASRMMCALRHIRQTSHHCDQREQHHFERSEKHHIAAGDASFDRHESLWYNIEKGDAAPQLVQTFMKQIMLIAKPTLLQSFKLH